MEYLREQLETQYSLNFDGTKEEINPINLDVYADVVYIEVFYRGQIDLPYSNYREGFETSKNFETLRLLPKFTWFV